MRFWLLVSALLMTSLGASGCGEAASPRPIYFGHIAAFSGPVQDAGNQAARGIRLALEELNQDTSARPFYVRHADTQGNPVAFESLAVRLTTINRAVALIGGEAPEEVVKLARAGAKKETQTQGEVLILSPAGYRPPGLGDFVYTTGLTPEAQGEALALYGWKELKKTTWVVIVDDTREEALHLARAFEKTLAAATADPKTKLRPKVVWLPFGKNQKMNELGKRVLVENPSGVLLAGRANDLAPLLSELGKPPNLVVLAGDGDFQQLPATEDEPIYATTTFVVNPEFVKAEEFAKKFKDAFGMDAESHAAQAYEGTRLLGDALRRTSIPTTANPIMEEVREELNKTKDFAGLCGPLSFGKDQQLRRPTVVVRWNGTKASFGKTYASDK